MAISLNMNNNNKPIFSTFLLIAILNSLLFSSSLARVFTQTTTVFDVSASSNRAQNALSITPPQFHSHRLSNSSLSLPLHSRLAIHKHNYKDYHSLVRARLARDAARVQSLNRNLNLALARDAVRPNSLTAPVVSGQSQGSGEYFARIAVGQPAQSFYLVPDTGSDITWLQCLPCSYGNTCYQQTDPIFNPTSSSSYRPLSCDSQQCQSLNRPGCQSGTCAYQVRYGDGSFTTGDFATETLTFGNSKSIPNLPIGCGHDNEGLFVGAAGLIGLGGGALSLSSQLKASSFSYCLVDRDSDSSSTLEFDSARPSDSITTPLLKNNRIDSYRYVQVTGMSVGGKALSISSTRFEIDGSGMGGIIVDSGTFITRLPTDVYESLKEAFVQGAQSLTAAGAISPFDTCYNLAGQSNVQVPTVAFELSKGKLLQLPARNYLIRMDTAGTYCLAFLKTTSSLSIIGSFQQQGMRVSYDLVNSLVGFSSNKC